MWWYVQVLLELVITMSGCMPSAHGGGYAFEMCEQSEGGD